MKICLKHNQFSFENEHENVICKMAVILFQPQCVNPKTAGKSWVHSQHWGNWCPSAKAPGHQYPQYQLNSHCIGTISYRNITCKINNIRIIQYKIIMLYRASSACSALSRSHCIFSPKNPEKPSNSSPIRANYRGVFSEFRVQTTFSFVPFILFSISHQYSTSVYGESILVIR